MNATCPHCGERECWDAGMWHCRTLALQQTIDGREVPHAEVVRETKGSARRPRAQRAGQSVPDAARDDAKHAASHAERGRR